MTFISPAAAFAGRIMLVAVFFLEAYIKINGYTAAIAYMQKFSVPSELLPLAIFVELVGSILIIVGWLTRYAALALAAFSLMAAALFHTNFSVVNETLHFWKDVGLAGGFLLLAAHGPGAWSVDEKGAKHAFL